MNDNYKTIQNLYCDTQSQRAIDKSIDPTANSEWPVYTSRVIDSKCEDFDIRVHEVKPNSSLFENVYTVDVYNRESETQEFHVGYASNPGDLDKLINIARERLKK